MVEKTLNDLFYDTLKDIYFAERQILKTLPKLAKAAKSEELKSAFLTHRDETEGHVDRLQTGLRDDWQTRRKRRPARRSRASSRKATRSWKSTREAKPSTQVSSLVVRRSSTTKCRAMAR